MASSSIIASTYAGSHQSGILASVWEGNLIGEEVSVGPSGRGGQVTPRRKGARIAPPKKKRLLLTQ
jgi:hypothetical protein